MDTDAQKYNIDPWSDLKLIRADYSITGKASKGAGPPRRKGREATRQTKTRQRFATRVRPNLFFFFGGGYFLTPPWKQQPFLTPVPPLIFPLGGSRISERAVSEKRSSLPENLLPADARALLNISYRSDTAAGRRDRMHQGNSGASNRSNEK